MNKNFNAFGALPPKDLEWQLGQTAASIEFVKEAEEAIRKLNNMILMIKNHEFLLKEELSIQDYLLWHHISLVLDNPK